MMLYNAAVKNLCEEVWSGVGTKLAKSLTQTVFPPPGLIMFYKGLSSFCRSRRFSADDDED